MKWPLGLLLCAGKQSRFHSSTPKSLLPFFPQGPCALDFALKAFQPYCQEIYVVIDETQSPGLFAEKISSQNSVHLLSIRSGQGDAHAIHAALCKLDARADTSALVGWGDAVFQNSQFISQLVAGISSQEILVPVVYEKAPYVKIIFEDSSKQIYDVQQSKKSEWDGRPGWHDLSCFSIPVGPYLKEYSQWIQAGQDDFSFMSLLKEQKSLIAKAVPVLDGTKSLSFNDLREHRKVADQLLEMRLV